MDKITDEEIKKALETLDGLVDNDTDENTDSGNDSDVEELVKSMANELDTKIKSLGAVNQYLIQQNENLSTQNGELREMNEEIKKSLDDVLSNLSKVSEAIEDMASSPINKLGTTLRKSVQVERFENGGDSGKESISLTRDKRKVLSLLEKSLSTEDGQRRLGQVVGLIENGFVNQDNCEFLRKSVENEIGGNLIITL